MKFLITITLFTYTISGFGQSVFSVIDIPNSIDTGVMITGDAGIGLVINNDPAPTPENGETTTMGLLINSGAFGLHAITSGEFSTAISGISNEGTGVFGQSERSGGSGVTGINHVGAGVRGLSQSSEGLGIQGTNTQGHAILGESTASMSQFAGVLGRSASSIGVIGESSISTGIIAKSVTGTGLVTSSEAGTGLSAASDSGIAIRARSISGSGIVATSSDGIAAKFAAFTPGVPDIEFTTTTNTSNGVTITTQDGVISSAQNSPNSSLRFWSNQAFVIELDRDGSDTNNSFVIRDSEGDRMLRVRETSGADLRGPLELRALAGDNGIIQSDRSAASSDLILDSYDDIVLELDNDGGESGELRVLNSGNAEVFRLTETGNLDIIGTLSQGSDVNRKHSISFTDNSKVLQKIDKLPIYNWKYDNEDIPHLGPMAQDFYASFGLGQGETTISSIDADGVALAAIKALIDKNEKLEKEITEIKIILKQLSDARD